MVPGNTNPHSQKINLITQHDGGTCTHAISNDARIG